jgi:hypothetical protein
MSLNLFGETLAYYYESIMFYTTGPWPRLEKPARDSSLLRALVTAVKRFIKLTPEETE